MFGRDTVTPPSSPQDQLQSLLDALLKGLQAQKIEPGDYIVIADQRYMNDVYFELLERIKFALWGNGIRLHIMPVVHPDAVKFMQLEQASKITIKMNTTEVG